MKPMPSKASILNISPYVGGKSTTDAAKKIYKLSSNEAALGVSPKVIAAIQSAVSNIYRYPDGDAYALRHAIANHHDLDAAKILCGNGSDELLSLIMQAYAGEGDEIIYSKHGFLMYPISALTVGAIPVAAEERDYHSHVDSILAKCSDLTKIVFLANPNNPTGTKISTAELIRLRESLPNHVILVLDAAYAEFVSDADYNPGEQLVDAYDNVVMCRTFSKIYALGGMRVGWCYAPAEIIDILQRVRGPFNVNSLGQVAAIAALEDKQHFQKTLEHTINEREKLRAGLESLGLHILPSDCNFLLVRFNDESQAIKANKALEQQGLIVRAMQAYHLPEALRITIGTTEENIMVQEVLQKFMEELS